MKDAFIEIYQSCIKRPGADKLLAWLESSSFFEDPASARHHLNVPGGLVIHSIHVYERLRELYVNEIARSKDGPVILTDEEEESICIVGLLHDLCKVGCYKKEPKNQKTYDPDKVKVAQKWQIKHDDLGDFVWETVMAYKFDDPMPYGHGEKSAYIASGFLKLSREEAMAIRWHMGFTDDTFKGGNQSVGNAFAKFPMAVMAHIADLQATYWDEGERSEHD